jgi:hypothetical protein
MLSLQVGLDDFTDFTAHDPPQSTGANTSIASIQ